MGHAATSSDLLARLEALTARVDEQAAEIERLKATPRPATSTPASSRVAKPSTSRRAMLGRLAGASAAAALLTATKEAVTAEAVSRTTVVGNSTESYGILSTFGSAIDPELSVPPLGSTTHSVLGTFSSLGPSPTRSASVTGIGSAASSIVGVQGLSHDAQGVLGRSTDGIGVQGVSTNNFGAGGTTNKAGFSGLFGYGAVPGSSGFYAAAVSGANAGFFSGRVDVQGDFTATGIKSAAVKDRKGQYRRMYCQEAPEPWFEDFGTADLRNGRAEVVLDAEFDEVVKGDDYRVFLTEIGDCGGLYVSRKGPHRFEVRSRGGASASGKFDFRVVARRGDIAEGRRLEKVELPKMVSIDHERLVRPDRGGAEDQSAAGVERRR
jgi:hypothetical protein